MAEEKKKKEADNPKQTIAQQLDAIAAKNSQIVTVRNMQQEKERLKDKVGRKQRTSLTQSRIQGLASLKNTLGTQNIK